MPRRSTFDQKPSIASAVRMEIGFVSGIGDFGRAYKRIARSL
jgi:hypothetical protein